MKIKSLFSFLRWFLYSAVVIFMLIGVGHLIAQKGGDDQQLRVGNVSTVKTLKIQRGISESAKACVECHAKEQAGAVADWKMSRHAYAGVSCVDCHVVQKDAPTAAQNCPGVKGTQTYVSPMVSPKVCGKCHPEETEQFSQSGHYRAWIQITQKPAMDKLMRHHEGRDNPDLKFAPEATGCIQCHGSTIELDENKQALPKTWPAAGMGTVYPDGGVGNCVTCHTRHKFSTAEARNPHSCAACHLGPDHPNIEIYENSKHGQIYKIDGQNWNWSSAPDAWEPGDYRAPTCATCHMSGIGELATTHNISARLKWNLWAKKSNLRNSPDPLSPLTGNHKLGRESMEKVCGNCHSTKHTKNFFIMADKMVELYNVEYYEPALKLLNELKEKKLLKENPWADEFQKVYYHLWHHQGRRMRHGAVMNGPDYAHWHGVFELQQDLNELKNIHKARMESGKIEDH